MLRTLRIPTVLALLALVAPAAEQPPHFKLEALQKRMTELIPDVEAALGAKIESPPKLEIVDATHLSTRIQAETLAARSRIWDGRRGDDLVQVCRRYAEAIGLTMFAKVDWRTGTLYVCPANFMRYAALGGSRRKVLSKHFVDMVLLQELIHVYQHQRFNLHDFVGAPLSEGELESRLTIIRGHARHVARRVATNLGLLDAFDLRSETQTRVPAGVLDRDKREILLADQTRTAATYKAGEEFFDFVAKKLGYADAVTRLFTKPPEKTEVFAKPDTYFEPTEEIFDFALAGKAVLDLVKETHAKPRLLVLDNPPLQNTVDVVGQEAIDRVMAEVVRMQVVNVDGQRLAVFITECKSRKGARALNELMRKAIEAKDAQFRDPKGKFVLVDSTYEEIDLDGAHALYAEKRLQHTKTKREIVPRVLIASYKEVGIELLLQDSKADREDMMRLARRVLEIVRSVREGSPWGKLSKKTAIQMMIRASRHPHWGVRWRALRSLAFMAEIRRDNEPDLSHFLVGALRDEDYDVRLTAVRALRATGRLRLLSPETLEAVTRDPDDEVRAALYAPVDVGREQRIALLLQGARDPVAQVRLRALDSLARLGAGNDVPWEVLRRGIEDDDPRVRIVAIGLLSEERIPGADLGRRFGSELPEKLREVVWADSFRGWPELIPLVEGRRVLLEAMKDDTMAVARRAVRLVSIMRPRAAEAPGMWLQLIGKPSRSLRVAILHAMMDLDTIDPAAVPLLIAMLNDWASRDRAAELLGRLGPQAKSAVRNLQNSLAEEDPEHRFFVARALWQIGEDPEPLARHAATMLRGFSKFRREDAAAMLGALGEVAQRFVPDLVAALKDTDPLVRAAAATALGDLGAKSAVPTLEQLAKDEADTVVGAAASAALGRLR